mgnify:CR=1 FL=1
MKTSDRLATILFLLAAPAARFLELKNNYDPAGLPTGGFPYLPAVLAAAAVVFLLSARGLPARDAVTADFGGIFRFDGQLTLTAAVLGGFLLLAAAALRLVSGGMAGLELILSVFLACSGAALLYALIAQRRSGAFAPTALLVPVCFLVVQLIVTYRANARDSVLGHFYVELLLLAALCLASLYLAAFAYRCGAPRSFAPAAHLALTLAAACCVDMALARRFAGLAACLGAALLLLACLEAALLHAEKSVGTVLRKAAFWNKYREISMNDRQIKMVNLLWDGFEGKLTSSKWGKITKCSADTALRDIQALIAKGILRKTDEGGRSTHYELIF